VAVLSKDHPADPTMHWLYLPMYRRVRRVASPGSGDVLGSDFTYADLGRVRIEAGEHRLKGNMEVEGRPCVVIATTNNDASLPYSRLVFMLDREHALPLRTEYYDDDGRLTRVASLGRIVDIDGRMTPLRISMTNTLVGGRSIIKLEDVRYNVGLDPSLFRVESIERAESFD
jgi:outer membrane lipoprotein-sorting protein